jgi:hypothetical protein
MNRRYWILAVAGLVSGPLALAQEDPGKAHIGTVSVTVYHATDGDPKTAGMKAAEVPAEIADRLRREERLRFKSYRILGSDVNPLLRSYESWAQPLKPSDEVMIRFEAQGRPTKKTAILDLELWLGRKKTIKTDARLEGDRPLFVLGPQWRGGRLIIAVALAQTQKKSK